jgi:hypothetical protein
MVWAGNGEAFSPPGKWLETLAGWAIAKGLREESKMKDAGETNLLP